VHINVLSIVFRARISTCEYFTLNRDEVCTKASSVKLYRATEVVGNWSTFSSSEFSSKLSGSPSFPSPLPPHLLLKQTNLRYHLVNLDPAIAFQSMLFCIFSVCESTKYANAFTFGRHSEQQLYTTKSLIALSVVTKTVVLSINSNNNLTSRKGKP